MNLIKILKEREITKLQLALKCEITPSDLYSAINGNKPFYPAWRRKISRYLEIDENEIFDGNYLRKEAEDEN